MKNKPYNIEDALKQLDVAKEFIRTTINTIPQNGVPREMLAEAEIEIIRDDDEWFDYTAKLPMNVWLSIEFDRAEGLVSVDEDSCLLKVNDEGDWSDGDKITMPQKHLQAAHDYLVKIGKLKGKPNEK